MSNTQIMPDPRPDEPCPCGSSKALLDCCLQEGRLNKSPSDTKPPGIQTGITSKGCYVVALRDCDGGPTTREHYISHSILKQLGDEIKIGGVSWADDAQRGICPKALAANILCKRHNESLGSLDIAANHLFQAIRDFHECKTPGWVLLAGEDIERWMLKLLAGFVTSGSPSRRNGIKGKAIPPERWLRILFGLEEMPDGWGLHFFDAPHADKPQMNIIEVTLNSHPDKGTIYGIRVGLMGFNLQLSMLTLNWDRPEHHIYRPRRFYLEDKATIEISWSNQSYNQGIILSRTADSTPI